MTGDRKYDVGYAKPPVHTRFRPGRSGNPKGRAPKTLNLKTDLELELSERIPIREGDRNLRVSKQRALLKAMLAKALKGDVRAANVVLQLVAKTIAPADSQADVPSDVVTDDEIAIVETFVERRLKAQKGGKAGDE